ncbi:hypothetical protein PSAC2689_80105 [Paraburkholderia sacchari]
MGYLLTGIGSPNSFNSELVRDLRDDRRAHRQVHDVKHHLQWSDSTRTRNPVTVDLEDASCKFDIKERLCLSNQVLPMCRALIPAQQARLCQNVRARADTTEHGSKPGETLHGFKMFGFGQSVNIIATADKKNVRGVDTVDMDCIDSDAIASGDGSTVDATYRPLEMIHAAYLIGHSQYFHRVHKRDHAEVRDQQEREVPRAGQHCFPSFLLRR